MSATLLVPLDGSPLAERALPCAERLARADACQLVMVRIADPLLTLGIDVIGVERRAIAEARQYLEHVASALAARGLDVQTVARCGRAAEEILREVRAAGESDRDGHARTLRARALAVRQRR